ncbi:MAG: ABC transporter ATP-binding protein [Acidimicrobiales bacterium]|nr:ABC transporter ATP-binding protein [Acidimicrobiaceae bacterium]MXV86467.1 ABC transporter ATP-binding protein [Acidimicrobiales bacterium]MCY3892281.1 ABC transporter ATP-binding protein [Acidimicrobiaceae bacterium]MDE0495770.1 ABC transporter ATP-binding protein [Acidimicrobiaceae bacterium]MDE0677814.1 ABC transporter ATP-binding protein [Acidimicrobiaceae bacterium]
MSESSSEPAVIASTTSLTQQFGSTVALDALDIRMRPGVTGLVGANGAGKTTLLNALLGLRPPTSGSATVLGLDPRSQGAALRAQVGFAPERDVLPDEMRAVDFVRHLAQVRGLPRSEARTRASDSLWLVGLGEERTRTLGTMSTGQRQRVKLAQAVASDPQLVLLDEPTSGLDPTQRTEMLTLIGEISNEHSVNVVLSSHLLEEVERVCDHIVALDAGRLIADGPITELVGDGEGITLELVDIAEPAGTVDAVENALRGAGIEVERTGTTLRLGGRERDVLCDRARDAVADAGARIRRLEARRRTLEDLFETAVV